VRGLQYSPVIVFKDKYIKLTYILGMFCPVMVIFNFAEDFISIQLVSYRFVLICLCDKNILILVMCTVKQEDATCIVP
jgi:hypothetical protein